MQISKMQTIIEKGRMTNGERRETKGDQRAAHDARRTTNDDDEERRATTDDDERQRMAANRLLALTADQVEEFVAPLLIRNGLEWTPQRVQKQILLGFLRWLS